MPLSTTTMTWIQQTDPRRGMPGRAPWMDELLGADADDHLPVEWTGNRTANVPKRLARAMVKRYDGIERYNGDNENEE